jgi:ATP-dependent Clp endopeptidase proteolytic subunit ClpP
MNWYDIQNNAKGETADIFIYSEVGGYDTNAKDFIEDLQDLKNKNINVHINSLGGSVFDGLAIYNALKNHTKTVTTKVEGICASIASVIAMAGDKIEMAENSLFMIHNPFAQTGGDANELRKTANILDKIRNEIADIYASKSKHDANHYINLMDVESWFNSKETLELGLINGITEPLKIENNYDVSMFNNITSDKINLVINNQNTKVMAENTANEVVENKDNAPTNDATLIGKIKSMLGVNPTNEHEEGHDESLAEETDWAKTYEELKDQVKNLEDAVHRIEEAMGMKDAEIENAQKEIDNKNIELENKSNEIAKLKAVKTDVKADADPTLGEATVDPNMAFFNAMVKAIKRSK